LRKLGEACSPQDATALQAGEVALVRRGNCTFRTKARVVSERGAVALLVGGRPGESAVQGTLGGPGVEIPVLALSAAAAGALPEGARARVRVRSISERRTTANVIAGTPGHTERRVAMIGAHLDSVAAGPGINDNASGSAAVLDTAERLARDPAVRDGVRFAFWGAEELGLFGSKRYVRRLDAAARERIVAYINLDMVASPKPRPMVYADDSPRIERLLRRGLRARGLRPTGTRLGGSSDHAPFKRHGIPIGGLFTGASPSTDPCYHRRCDDFSNVDLDMARDNAYAARRALRALAPG
jgi:acetylornithine deacetylase/succinyl-diaminopimelate desuccinylase-like protein